MHIYDRWILRKNRKENAHSRMMAHTERHKAHDKQGNDPLSNDNNTAYKNRSWKMTGMNINENMNGHRRGDRLTNPMVAVPVNHVVVDGQEVAIVMRVEAIHHIVVDLVVAPVSGLMPC